MTPTQTHKLITDEYGRLTCGNYTIEAWKDRGTWSIYNRYNSMYDCKDGFRSIDEAVAYINR